MGSINILSEIVEKRSEMVEKRSDIVTLKGVKHEGSQNVLVVVGFYECLLFVHVSTTANCVMCLKVLVIQRDTFSRLSGLPSPEG